MSTEQEPRPTQAIGPPTTSVRVSDAETLDVWTVGEGRPVLLVHGALFFSLLRPLAERLSELGFQGVWYHRRGYAGKGATPNSVEDQADDAVKIMDALGLPNAHVVGHSAASCFVLELAGRAPDRVQSATLLDFVLPAQVPSGHLFVQAMQPVAEMAQAGDLEGASTLLLAGLGCTEELMDKALPGSWAHMLKDAPTWFGIDGPALGQWKADEKRTRAIKIPVAALTVSQAPPFQETLQLLQDWLPELHELKLATDQHFFPITETRQAAEVLADWLSSQKRAG